VSERRIPRSTEATSGPAAAAVARRRRALPNGVWGVILLIATEATLFGTLLVSYWYLRVKNVYWPPPGVESPKVVLPLVLTGVLVATSVPMFLAVRATRRARPLTALWLILVALLVQGVYLGLQIHLFASDLDKFSPADSAYGSIYFTLLATHHVHVLVGMLLSLFLIGRLIFGLTSYRVIGVRVAALYWHFVNVMAVLVVLTQLSPSL
jgi:heme/copper-type cytochrome/quinol oxidase subunit 3